MRFKSAHIDEWKMYETLMNCSSRMYHKIVGHVQIVHSGFVTLALSIVCDLQKCLKLRSSLYWETTYPGDWKIVWFVSGLVFRETEWWILARHHVTSVWRRGSERCYGEAGASLHVIWWTCTPFVTACIRERSSVKGWRAKFWYWF